MIDVLGAYARQLAGLGGVAIGSVTFGGTAAAEIDLPAALQQAMADCKAFVADERLDVFQEEPSGTEPPLLYLQTEDRTDVGLTLEYQHSTAKPPDEDGGAALPGLWSCRIENTRLSRLLWRAEGADLVFTVAEAVISDPKRDTRRDEEFSRRYHGCSDPDAPTEYSVSLSGGDRLWVSVTTPALNEYACRDIVRMKNLLFACIHHFAKPAWDRIRAETGSNSIPDQVTIQHQFVLADIVTLPEADGNGVRVAAVETEYGPTDLFVIEGGQPRCGMQTLPGFTGGSEPFFDFLVSASTFYDGVFFRLENGRGYLTCAESFPNLAVLVRPDPVEASADAAHVLTVEPMARPEFLEFCGEG